MTLPQLSGLTLPAAMSLLTAVALSGCASAPEIEDNFIAATGTTWRAAGEVLVYERTEPRYSRSARDYAYIGPVALNRRGTYDYFLWVGIGSTLDRGFLAPENGAPQSLLLFIDDEPHELTLSDWSLRVAELPADAPYDPPVSVQWTLAARVTLDQIELISSRGIDRLLLRNSEGHTREFHAWGEQPHWAALAAGTP